MATCAKCGKPAGLMADICPNCRSNHSAEPSEVSLAHPKGRDMSGNTALCVILGILFLGGGLYFLLNPANDLGSTVANLHRLTLGETFSIVGAIFLAAGIRPRG